jgi:hypothetical protein
MKPIQEYYSWEGKKHKPETIDKIKLSKKGQGTGESNSQYGSQWINNGIKNKKIKIMGIIPTGWKLGRINLEDNLRCEIINTLIILSFTTAISKNSLNCFLQ